MLLDGSLIAAASFAATALSFGLAARHYRRTSRALAAELRRRDEVAAVHSEGDARYRVMLDHAPQGCVVWEPGFAIVEWNRQAERIFGWTRAEMIGRNLQGVLIPPSARAGFQRDATALFAGGMPSHVVLGHETRNGGAVTCDWYHAVLRDQDGAPVRVVSLCTDVTEQMASRARLDRLESDAAQRGRERLYREVFEHSSDVLFVVEVGQKRELRFESLNPAAAEAFGMPAAALRGADLAAIVAGRLGPDFGASLAANIGSYVGCAVTGMPAEYEGALDLLPVGVGGPPQFHVRLIPLAGDAGIERIIGIGHDVTVHKRYEAELLARVELEARMSRYFENAPGFFTTLVHRPDGSYAMPFASAGIRDTHGLDPADVAEDISRFVALTHPDDLETTFRRAADSARDLSHYHVEYRINHPQKGERWIECRSQPYRETDGGTTWYGFYHDVTERKQMEALLEQREREYHSLAENLPDNIARWDVAGRILFSNPTHQRTLRKPAVDLIGKTHGELFPDGRYGPVDEAIAQIVANGKPATTMRAPEIREDGEIRFHDVKLVPEHAADGKIVSVLGIGRDMTDIYRMQEAIAAREQEFRSLAESSPDYISRYDAAGRICYINARLVALLGLNAAAEMMGKQAGETSPHFAALGQAVARAMEMNAEVTVEAASPTATGESNFYQIRVVPERDVAGQVIGAIAFGRDITDLKRYTQSLLERAKLQERIAALASAVPGFLFTIRVDTDGHAYFPYASAGIEDLFGLRPEDIRPDAEVLRARYHPDDLARLRELMATTERTLAPFRIEIRIRHAEQGWRWIDIRSTPQRQPDGTTEWHGVMLDISARKAAEESVRQLNASLGATLQAIPDAMFEVDRDGTYHDVWAQDAALLAAEKERLLGHTLAEMLPPDAAETSMAALREADASGKSYGRTICLDLPEGQRWFELSIARKADAVEGDGRFICLSRDVTERKRIEAALVQREREFRSLAENSPDPIYRYDRKGRRLYVNPAVARIVGKPVEALIGRSPDDCAVIVSAEAQKLMAAIRDVFDNGATIHVDLDFIDRDGRHRDYDMVLVPEHDAAGKVATVLGIARDMTAVRDVERRMTDFVASIPGFVYSYHLSPAGHGSFPFVSPGIEKLYGLKPADVKDDVAPLHALAHVDDRPRILAALAESARAMTPVHVEYRICRPGLPERWAEFRSLPVRQADGAMVWHGIMLDIDERKRAHQRLFLLEFAMNRLRDGAVLTNRAGRILNVNLAIGEMLGYAQDELVGRPLFDIVPDLTPETWDTHWQGIVGMGGTRQIETRNRTRHGADIPVEVAVSIFEFDGKAYSLALVRDITERRQALEALRLKERSLAEAQRMGNMGSWDLDLVTGVLSWSDEIFRIFEIDPARFAASYEAFLAAVHPEDRDKVNAAYTESLERGTPYGIDHRLLFGDGRIKYVHERCETDYDRDGKPLRSRGTVQDITERKDMEAALQVAVAEAQCLAEMRSGFLARMSHELRTPLNGILGYTQNLLDDATLNGQQAAGLHIIRQSGDHLLTLINDILDHARMEADKLELRPKDISVRPFLDTICGIVRVKAEQKNLAFHCAVDDLPGVVRGDEQRLRQVLLNLLSNAVKFTDSGEVGLRASLAAPARIRFAIHDTGTGIDASQVESIFRSFEQGGAGRRRAEGAGLGLAISRHLVRLMGGDIAVASRPGGGSVFSFEVEMPAVADAPMLVPDSVAAAATGPVPPRHELDILLGLAQRGNMQNIVLRAGYLAELDAAYRPFADQLILLARNFQSRALLGLIERTRNGSARS